MKIAMNRAKRLRFLSSPDSETKNLLAVEFKRTSPKK